MVKHLWLLQLLTLVLLPVVLTSTVAEVDARTIMRGFCDGLDLDSDITDDSFVEGDDLADVITLLSAENRKFALKGLKKLGSVLGRVPDIITNRGGNPDADKLYLTKLLALATDLEKIDAYEPQDNNNLTILGVEIVDEVNNATNSLNAGEFYNAGLVMGMALANVFTATQPPVSDEVAAEVQEKAEDWTAGDVPEDIKKYETIDELRQSKLGIPEEYHMTLVNEQRRRRRLGIVPPQKYARASYPASFDARTKWPNCIHPIRHQGDCGSCWAFAGTNVLADRFCIASNGKIKKVLSPQYIVECDTKKNGGCNGGVPYYEFQYIQKNGVYQESCFPYIAGKNDKLYGSCPAKCRDGSTPNKLYTSDALWIENENDIKYQLMNFGPLTTAFTVYQDFFQYKSGIYSHTSGGKAGGHAVKLIGWGTDEKTKKQYWICANSWGADWGENGYFKIKFGDSDINCQVSGGTPDLQRSVTSNNNGADIPKENNGGNSGGAEFNKDKDKNGGSDYNDGGNNDANSNWGNEDTNSNWGNEDANSNWGNEDWGNDDQWSNDDQWGNDDQWSNDDQWGNDDQWSNNDEWGNDNWRRNWKSGIISNKIRSSIHRSSPTTRRKAPMARRRSVAQNQRTSSSSMLEILKEASAHLAEKESNSKP